jgi:hypothetical protein
MEQDYPPYGHQPVTSAEENDYEKAVVRKYLRIQPLWQFSLLCFVSFGLYKVYWFYKSWKFFKEYERDEEIMPFWRAVFVLFFGYDLFSRILYRAQQRNYAQGYSAGWVLVAFVIISATNRLPGYYALLSFFSFVPLLPVVHAQNHYFAEEDDDGLAKWSFTGEEIVTLIVGGACLALVLFGLLTEEGIIPAE